MTPFVRNPHITTVQMSTCSFDLNFKYKNTLKYHISPCYSRACARNHHSALACETSLEPLNDSFFLICVQGKQAKQVSHLNLLLYIDPSSLPPLTFVRFSVSPSSLSGFPIFFSSTLLFIICIFLVYYDQRSEILERNLFNPFQACYFWPRSLAVLFKLGFPIANKVPFLFCSVLFCFLGFFQMGSDKHILNFHLPLPHLHHGKREVPKGCLAIMVGQGEEQQKMVVPVLYFNHPLFMQLLKEAEEEYGFDQKGPITIPCHITEFRYVQGLIDKERISHNHHVGCFGA